MHCSRYQDWKLHRRRQRQAQRREGAADRPLEEQGRRRPSAQRGRRVPRSRVCALRQRVDRPAAGRGRPPARSPSLLLRVRPSLLPSSLSIPLLRLSRSPAFRRSIDRSYQKAERDPGASGRASGGMISKRPDEGERGNGKGARILQAESIPLALRPPSPRWRWLDIK